MLILNPYLNFNGNCKKAFEFYKSVFGGEFQALSYFSEMPDNLDFEIPEKDKNKIMHVSLPIGDKNTLMGCDAISSPDEPEVSGNNFSISINTKSVRETKSLFEKLSKGGIIKMPLDKTFWNSYFGMLSDQFGINWMINCELDEKSNNN